MACIQSLNPACLYLVQGVPDGSTRLVQGGTQRAAVRGQQGQVAQHRPRRVRIQACSPRVCLPVK